MNWLDKILSKDEKMAVGLISGTSMDGIDSALVKIKGSGLDTEVKNIDFLCLNFSPESKKLLKSIESSFSFQKLSDLNFMVGSEFAKAAEILISANNFKNHDIDFIGSHGQTINHNPPSLKNELSSTFQIGEIDVICEQTGITTVGDFRKKDIASGGEGAPFIPYADFILFRNLEKNVVAQNIGGIANCTLVASKWDDIVAFDSGPGNSLLDSFISMATEGEKSFDKDGELASKGNLNNKIFNKLLEHPFFKLPPPKSTGKELFGLSMAKEILDFSKNQGIKLEDVLYTLVELTSETIVSSYEKFIFPYHKVEEVILSGGGAHNSFLVEKLSERLGQIELSTSDKYGISVDAKEAVGFAIFANEALHGNTTNISKITGAKNKNILGKISIGRN